MLVALSGLLVLISGAGGAGSAGSTAGGSARAVAVRVVIPGQPGASAASISSPPDHAAFGSSFAYPADGSVVTTGSISASAATTSGAAATATSTTQVGTINVFGGEITATTVTGSARGSTRGRNASGNFSGATVTGLTVLGTETPPAPNIRIPLADWGYLTTLEEGTDSSLGTGGAQGYHGFVTALAIHVTAAHGGLSAGSEIQIGYADASVQASAPAAPKPVVPPGTPPKQNVKKPGNKNPA